MNEIGSVTQTRLLCLKLTRYTQVYADFSGGVGEIMQYSVNYLFDVLFLLDIMFKYRYFAFEEEGM